MGAFVGGYFLSPLFNVGTMNESDFSIPALLVSLRVRYPDLITQRLLKATQQGKPAPYNKDELDVLAAQVERQVAKSAAALLLESTIGERFDCHWHFRKRDLVSASPYPC